MSERVDRVLRAWDVACRAEGLAAREATYAQYMSLAEDLDHDELAEFNRRSAATSGEVLVCARCGSDEVTTWAEDGEAPDADYAECLACKHHWSLAEVDA